MAAIVWLRQDLRCYDNPALSAACNNHPLVLPLYILDEKVNLLGGAQKWWLHHSLLSLQHTLKTHELNLCLRKGDALPHLLQLIEQFDIDTVYWNRGYDPLVVQQDNKVQAALKKRGILVVTSNGSLLNEPAAIKNKTGSYFKVFTPYWRHCLQQGIFATPSLISGKPISPNTGDTLAKWDLLPKHPNWAAEFENYWQPGEAGALKNLDYFIHASLHDYKELRNVPSRQATSKLSPHLHFGEISPGQIWRALQQAKYDKKADLPSIECFLSELGWREFSYYLLYHFPKLPTANFKVKFDSFPWVNDNLRLKKWQQGMTGYPIVDAGMRELWRTGYMHNRVRMIVASFLTKNLLIDWRKGAAWFLDTLLDADIANNSAGWQWVAGSGADAAPYYRIFNPVLQGEKFDPHGDYVRKWVPELSSVSDKWIHKPWCSTMTMPLEKSYPKPIVDYNESRKIALSLYKMSGNVE